MKKLLTLVFVAVSLSLSASEVSRSDLNENLDVNLELVEKIQELQELKKRKKLLLRSLKEILDDRDTKSGGYYIVNEDGTITWIKK